jgi:hypothetical protein
MLRKRGRESQAGGERTLAAGDPRYGHAVGRACPRT